MRQPLHFSLAQRRASIQSAITRNKLHLLIQAEQMWDRNGNSHNHRKVLTSITSDMILFQQHFFTS